MKNKLGTIGLVFILIEALSILFLNGITLKQEIEESIATKSDVSIALTVPTNTWISPTYMILMRPERDIVMIWCNGLSYQKEVVYTGNEITYRKLYNLFDDWTTGEKRYDNQLDVSITLTIEGMQQTFSEKMRNKFNELTLKSKRFTRAMYGKIKHADKNSFEYTDLTPLALKTMITILGVIFSAILFAVAYALCVSFIRDYIKKTHWVDWEMLAFGIAIAVVSIICSAYFSHFYVGPILGGIFMIIDDHRDSRWCSRTTD